MTARIKMTLSQLRAMIVFHARAEAAYRATGQLRNAEQARARREALERQLQTRKDRQP